MPLAPQAPYDTLATVTAQTRTYLGDYIQGINPSVSGTLNTNALAVTWVSGAKFSYLLNGQAIVINGISYTVALVTSATTLTLLSTAGVQNGVAYSALLPTGDIFADSQAYVLPTVNLAWRKLQQKLDQSSHPRTRNETVLYSLPVSGSLDPAVQSWVNWTNYFDGANLWSPAAPPPATGICPVLPQDFMSPNELWERQSVGIGVVNPLGFKPMKVTVGRLPDRVKGSWNGIWDWREDAIYFAGAILPLDVRISYRAFLADIAVSGSFATTPIKIMRCSDALAYYSAGIFVTPRGAKAAGDDFMAKGDLAVNEILTNRQGKLLQYANVRRQAVYQSGTSRRGGSY
jgi:hypothetical protein